MIIHESVCRYTHSYIKVLVVYISAKFRFDKIILQNKSGELTKSGVWATLASLRKRSSAIIVFLVSMFG